MSISAALARKLMEIDPPLREAMLLLVEEMEKQREQMAQQVTRAEFNELKEIVADLVLSVRELAEAQKRTEQRVNELAEAQKRTEERLERLEITVGELIEAQKQAEVRLTRLETTVAELAEAQKRTEQRVNELAEAQKRTEERLERLEITVGTLIEAQKQAEVRLTRLETTVAELAEAQKRTEQRVNELAEAQKRTEERLERLEITVGTLIEAQKQAEVRLTRLETTVAELAEAQKRTEEELRKLAAEHRVTRERVEGLSNTVGYSLEDRAYKSLPAILGAKGIRVEGRLIRRYVQIGKKERQVNIYGHGYRNGQRVLILGEAKVRPSRREVDRFLRLVRQLEEREGLPAVTLFVAYDFLPSVEAYIQEQGILPVWSYELE